MFLQRSLEIYIPAAEETEAVSQAAETTAAGIAAQTSSFTDPITYLYWILALLAIAGIWYFYAKQAYIPRRYRRTLGKGPLRHFVDNLVHKISGFLS